MQLCFGKARDLPVATTYLLSNRAEKPVCPPEPCCTLGFAPRVAIRKKSRRTAGLDRARHLVRYQRKAVTFGETWGLIMRVVHARLRPGMLKASGKRMGARGKSQLQLGNACIQPTSHLPYCSRPCTRHGRQSSAASQAHGRCREELGAKTRPCSQRVANGSESRGSSRRKSVRIITYEFY